MAFDPTTAVPENNEGSRPSFDPSTATPEGTFDPSTAIAAPEPKKGDGSSLIRRVVADPGISLLKGAIAVPEAAVGLGDIVTGGDMGRLLESGAGFRPKEAKSALDDYLSPEQKAANQRVSESKGFIGRMNAMLENPSTIAHSVVESTPLIGAGGVVGRGITAVAPKVSGVAAGASGEGAVGAGLAAEQFRQGSEDGTITDKQAVASLMSGGGTGAVGYLGGRLAQKMGVVDPDVIAAGGARAASDKGIIRRVAGGALSEGVFEEMPQSMQEQAWQNLGNDKPIMEGVAEAGAAGALTGAAMGGAFNIPRHAATKPPGLIERAALRSQPMAAPVVDPAAGNVATDLPTMAPQDLAVAAQRRMESIVAKLNGTPDTTVVDPATGQQVVIPGEQKQIVTPEEQAELQFLTENAANPQALAEAYGVQLAEAAVPDAQELAGQIQQPADPAIAEQQRLIDELNARIPEQPAQPVVEPARDTSPVVDNETGFDATQTGQPIEPPKFQRIDQTAQPDRAGQIDLQLNEIRRPNGAIGTQGVVESQVRDVLTHVADVQVPDGATMRDMVEALRSDPEAQQRLRDFTVANPLKGYELPDGTIQIEDGHHRAFLLDQIGDATIPASIADYTGASQQPQTSLTTDIAEASPVTLPLPPDAPRFLRDTYKQAKETVEYSPLPLPPQSKALEKNAHAIIDRDGDAMVDRYIERFGNVVDPDQAKLMFSEFELKPELAAAFHEPSSRLSKMVYAKLLATRPGKTVLFSAGGGGSGKSVALEVIAKNDADIADSTTFDGTLASYKSSKAKIDTALDAGAPVRIIYTNREVGKAFEGAMERSRVVPIDAIIDAHVGAAQTIRRLAKEYAGNPNVEIEVINNNGSTIEEVSRGKLDDIPAYSYDEVKGRLYDQAKRALDDGRIDQRKYEILVRGSTRGGAGKGQAAEQGQIAGPAGDRAGAEAAQQEVEAPQFSRADKKPSFQRVTETGHRREGSTGRYVGAPDWIGNSPVQLGLLRKKLRQLTVEGESGRYWYEKSSKAVMDLVGGDKVDAEKFVGLLAIYSQGTEVSVNLGFALEAYYQWKAGLPIDTGRFPTAQTKKADTWLKDGKDWGGIKTNNFYADLMEEIDPSKFDEGHATMDMWMAIAFDYGMKVLDQGPKYNFAKRETARLANELGWKPHQVQAAIWTAIKARTETSEKERNAAELKAGIAQKNGNAHSIIKGKEYEHFRTAHKFAMDKQITTKEIADRGVDFADALKARAVQMSWEATPGATTGVLPGIHNATTAQLSEYLVAIDKALHDTDGRDLIAELINLHNPPTLLGFSAWQGKIGAGAQSFFPVPVTGQGKDRAVLPVARDMLNRYAALKGYILSQEAVVWHHAVHGDAQARNNGAEIRTPRALTEDEMRALYDGVSTYFSTTELAPAYTANGARILNFVDGLDNKVFQKGVRAVMDSLPDGFGGGDHETGFFRSDGDYISNDWKEHPNGEGYIQAFAAGRPDLLGRADDLRAVVTQVNQDFSDRYGWGEATPSFSRSDAAGDRRTGEAGAGTGYGTAQENSVQVNGVHYSGRWVGTLDSSFYGNGMPGAEARRLDDWSAIPEQKHRIYFYVDTGKGVDPESGVGNVPHYVTLNNLYDWAADPLGFWADSRSKGGSSNDIINRVEQAIMAAGFDGLYDPDSRIGDQGVAVLLGKRRVETAEQPKMSRAEGKTGNVATPVDAKASKAVSILNQGMARYLKDTAWENAYAPGELHDTLSAIGEALEVGFGARVIPIRPTAKRFDIFNGVHFGGNIYVNTQADVGFANIAGHELFHELKRKRPDLYQWFAEQSRQYYKDFDAYQKKLNSLLQDGEAAIDQAAAEEELLSDFAGDSLADPKFLQGLADASPTKFRQLLMAVRAWIDGAIAKLKGNKSELYVTDLQAMRDNLSKALVAFAEGRQIAEVAEAVPAMSRSSADGAFYSPLARAFSDAKMATMTGEGWAQWMKANMPKLGVKKDEVTWSGINEYLDLRGKDKISKEEVAGFLEQNGVSLGEEVRGGNKLPDIFYFHDITQADWDAADETQRDDWRAEYYSQSSNVDTDAGTKFSQYVPDGGIPGTYREILVTLPVNGQLDYARAAKIGYDREDIDSNPSLKANLMERFGTGPVFKSGHWKDTTNVLVHLRVDEVNGAGNERLMRVIEVQSDWGQEGKREGFKGAVEPANISEMREQMKATQREIEKAFNGHPEALVVGELPADLQVSVGELYAERRRIGNEIDAFDNAAVNGVPAAPFVTDTKAWVALGIKRAIQQAVATDGIEGIVFATGQENADLYDLSKQVQSITAMKSGGGRVTLFAKDENGEEVELGRHKMEDLDRVVGKEMAKKIADQKTPNEVYKGLDLKVGGEGMRAFYDQIVPSVAKDVLRQLGMPTTLVGRTQLPGDQRATATTTGGKWGVSTKDGYVDGNRFDTQSEARDAAAEYNRTHGRVKIDLTPALISTVNRDGIPLFSRANKQPYDIPEDTKLEAARRQAQDKFLRFQTIQESIELTTAQDAGYKGKDIHAARQYMLDHGIKNPITDATDVYQAETLSSSRIASRKQDFREDRIEPLLKKTAKAGITMDEIADYLLASHAKEANARVQTIRKDPQATAFGMTDQEAATSLQAFQARRNFAEIDALANEWRQITEDTKRMLVAGGIISQDMANAWDSTYSHYVPLKGVESQQGAGKGLSVNGKQKRRMGHGSREEAVIANILRDYERAVTQVERNKVGMTLVRFALEISDDNIITLDRPVKRAVFKDGKAYEVLYHGSTVGVFSSDKDARAFIALDTVRSKRTPADYTTTISHDPHVVMQASPMLGDNEVNVYVAGQVVRVQINDELAARAYTNMGVEGVNKILSGAREFNTWLSKAYTGYNPEFLLRNLFRDAIQGTVTLTGKFGVGTMAKIYANYPAAMKELSKHYARHGSSQIVREARADGMQIGSSYLSDLERIGDDVMTAYNEYAGMANTYQRVYAEQVATGASKSKAQAIATMRSGIAGAKRVPIIGHFLSIMEHLNAVVENSLRLATYKTLRDEGHSRAQAAAAGKNLMNFNRKGEVSNQAGALYLFFNPNLQGTHVMLQALTSSKYKTQAQALTGMMALAAFALAEMGRGGDDDDEEKWKNIPSHVRDRNMVFMVGDKQITIPVPYGFGVFHSLGNAVSDFVHGESGWKLGLRMMSAFSGNFSPFGNPLADDNKFSAFQLLPTIPKMALGPDQNENSFGAPLMPIKYSDAKPDSQNMYRSTKGTVYSAMAEGMNEMTGGSKYEKGLVDVSPETLRFWVSSLTGGTGRFMVDSLNLGSVVTQGATPELREIPMARVLVREESINDVRRAYWDRVNEAGQAAEEFAAAKRSHDSMAMREIMDDNRTLIRLAKYSERQQKLIKAKRDLVDRIRQDETLSLTQKRDKIKQVEAAEEKIYNKFISAFDDAKGE